MTAPIGYPEKFGVILDQRRELTSPELTQKPPAPGEPTQPSFGETLTHFVSGIDQMQKTARTQAEEFAVGKTNDIHNTMIDVEQAEISLRMLANVRNRVVDLYREVMRMGS